MTSIPDSDSSTSDFSAFAPGPPDRMIRRRGAGHVIALVVGCLLLLPALGVTVGGVAVLVGERLGTDDDGYFRLELDRVETDGVAVIATDLQFDDDLDADAPVLDVLDIDIRVSAQATGGRDIFIGVGRSADVNRYLDGAAFSEILDLDRRTPLYRQTVGTGSVSPPGDEMFWIQRSEGAGRVELTWEPRGGQWTAVVMNADGSPIVASDLELGARSGAITVVAVILLIVGGLGLVTSIALIVVGGRGRKERAPMWPSTPVPPPPAMDHAPSDPDRESTSVR